MKEPAVQKKTPEAVLQKASATSSPVLSTRSAGHPILQLQRAIGNQGVQRFIRRKGLQTDLKVNEPGDIYEQEADRIAEQVVSAKPVGTIQRKCAACAEGTITHVVQQNGEQLQRVQMQAKEGAATGGAPSGREKGLLNFPSTAAPGGLGLTSAPPIVHEALSSPGQPLGMTERAFFEPRFGSDFGDVRVHTDSAASKSATAVNARAYTAGKSIVFAAGQYAPHSHAGQRLLAHELAHVVQQRNGVVSPSSLQREPAGGCGLCYGDPVYQKMGARNAGIAAHLAIQNELAPLGIDAELPWGNGRVDVAVVRPISKEVAIAEIKPANEKGIDDGIEQIEERLRVLPELEAYAGYKWVPLDPHYEITRRIYFPTFAPVCTPPYVPQPLYCYSHDLSVAGPVDGHLYLYFCEPSYAELKRGGCSCECKKPEEKEQPKDKQPKDKQPKDNGPGPLPIPSLPELLKLGAKVWALVAAEGLLSSALSFALSFAAGLTPFLALAALAVGIVFLWDKIKSVAHMIFGAAKLVWNTISSVVALVRDTLKEIGIAIGELAVFVGGLIKDIAEAIAEGLLAAGRALISGAKWLGGKIAEGAEAFVDWLFGDDVEAMVPNVELPLTEEPTMHCGTVAREDALIQMNSDLLFPFGKWKLEDMGTDKDTDRAKAEAVLKEAAAKVLATPRTKDDPIRFLGYTDVIGEDIDNEKLSKRRAEAVADWFVENGFVPRDKVKTDGFGETQAQAQADDEKGRKKDRRVDILVTKSGSAEKRCW